MSIFNAETHKIHAALAEAADELQRATMNEAGNQAAEAGTQIVETQRKQLKDRLEALLVEYKKLDESISWYIARLAQSLDMDQSVVISWILALLVKDGECKFLTDSGREVVITVSADLKLLLSGLVAEEIPSFSTLLLEVLAKKPTKAAPKEQLPTAAVEETTSEPLVEVPADEPIAETVVVEPDEYIQSRQYIEAKSRGEKTKVQIFDYLYEQYSNLDPAKRLGANGVTVRTLMQQYQITQTVANQHLRTIEKILNQNGAPLRLIPQEDGRKFRWKLVSSADYTQTVTAEQPDDVVIEANTLVPADEEQQAETDPVTTTVELLKAQLRTTKLVPVFEQICEIWAAQGNRKRTLSRNQILMEDGQPISKWLLERLSLILAQIEAPYQLVCFSNTTPHVWLLMTLEDLESRRSEITRSLDSKNLTVAAEPNHFALSSTEISRLDALLSDPPPKPTADHEAPAAGQSEPLEKKS